MGWALWGSTIEIDILDFLYGFVPSPKIKSTKTNKKVIFFSFKTKLILEMGTSKGYGWFIINKIKMLKTII